MSYGVTPEALRERRFQTIIKEHLVNVNGYRETTNTTYNKHHAIDLDTLFEFLEVTQNDEMDGIKKIYKTNYRNKIIERLEEELRDRSMIDVLKNGIKDRGVKLSFAYFQPPTTSNPKLLELYEQNILTVTEELNYEGDKRIDLVIFLNGLPVITFELKNSLTGQTYKNAEHQYKTDRSKKETLFRFKERAIVNFAMDTEYVSMTTKLEDEDTFFLPFNKGSEEGGSGNPNAEGKLKTHYMWEEVLQKDSLMEILHKFVFVKTEETEQPDGSFKKKTNIIFPRYHQLDAVRSLLNRVKQDGVGQKYLIQHSAGSGKTNSITWLSHRLASLHDNENNNIYDAVIVVSDRNVLDQQLQKSILQLEHKKGLVTAIDNNSAQLASELEKNTKIVISTIQKFPYILDTLSGTKDKRYAIVIDEAHSSTSGKNMMALKESLSLEEALVINEQEEKENDMEDRINEELEKFHDTGVLSFFAFTATPKPSTLRLFGTQIEEEKFAPFHVYSMKQAIEEGFILDVLKNYMTYKMFFKFAEKIEKDEEFDKAKATRKLTRIASLHPTAISQKTQIVIEHFRAVARHEIGGQAKAMMVTGSRKHAVLYKLAFDKYLKSKGYDDMKTLVAFSGSVSESGEAFTETQMNGIKEAKLPLEFDKDENKVLIVANKYQTGFDQPKLHTMYVDKKLSGVKAVQTLSRLNRVHPGKNSTFILDFVNNAEDIQEAFKPFYETTILGNDIDPNEIYALERKIYDEHLFFEEDVDKFARSFFKQKHTKRDTAVMNNIIDEAAKMLKPKSREELIDIKSMVKKFLDLYLLIIQVTPFQDADLHKLSVFLRFFLKKIDIEGNSGFDLTNKAALEYLRIEEQELKDVSIKENDSDYLKIKVAGGGAAPEEKDFLSNIIKKINERYGTDFSESEKLAVEQIRTSFENDEDMKKRASQNTQDDFKLVFESKFVDKAVDEYEKNQNFYGRVLQDSSFRDLLIELLLPEVYSSLRANN